MLQRLRARVRISTLVIALGAIGVVALLVQAYPRPPAPRPIPAITPGPARTPTTEGTPAPQQARSSSTPAPTRTPFPTRTPRPRPSAENPVNLNTADRERLEDLPGIGRVRADRIIESRTADGPFRAPADLLDRKIVPQGVFNQLKDSVTVE